MAATPTRTSTPPAAVGRAEDPDHALIERVAEGDADAFEALVERYQDRLLALAERLLGDRDEARDAVQEVFLKVWRKAGSYRPRGKLYTWLYRVAVNHCFNKLRRRRLVRFLSLGRPDPDDAAGADRPGPPDPADPATAPDEALAARRRWRATRRAIDRLPEGQRAVVVLAKLQGLSYREIAEVLEVTVGAVESRLFRAMRRLEAAAQEDAPPGVS